MWQDVEYSEPAVLSTCYEIGGEGPAEGAPGGWARITWIWSDGSATGGVCPAAWAPWLLFPAVTRWKSGPLPASTARAPEWRWSSFATPSPGSRRTRPLGPLRNRLPRLPGCVHDPGERSCGPDDAPGGRRLAAALVTGGARPASSPAVGAGTLWRGRHRARRHQSRGDYNNLLWWKPEWTENVANLRYVFLVLC